MKTLQLPNDSTRIKALIFLMLIAYMLALAIRYLWVIEIQGFESFYWNNTLMINTNDGYFFAEGARDILSGNHQANDLSPISDPLAILTAFLAKLLPIGFESLILYMSAVFGSLIVVPVILIGHALRQTRMGFIAALIAGIAHSYYNRTMIGYYDTDMFNIVFPLFSLYFIILAILHQQNRYLLPITFSFALSIWWYPSAYALNSALLVMIMGYVLLFERKNHHLYQIALFAILGIIAIPMIYKLSLAIILFAFFHFRPLQDQKWFWAIFVGVVILYFANGGVAPIWSLLKGYVLRDTVMDDAHLHFFNVAQTVREAGNIPFNVFAERISGHTITFVLSVIGYFMAIVAYRPLLITLPFVGLGFIAMSSGLRFTIYAVAPMAIGFAYLILFLTRPIEKPWLKIISQMVFTITALYPNYLHAKEYLTPTVMTNQEVSALDKLKKASEREDYVVSWWDYGYPIRYYSDVKTWIDGGKHSGDVNYPASYVLSSNDPVAAANMLRLFTEYTEKSFSETNKTVSDFEYMMSKEGFQDPDEFLTSLSLPEYKLPKKTRNVYLYLPLRMLDIFPTVCLFSNLDLKGSTPKAQPFYYVTSAINDTGSTVELGNGVLLIKEKNVIRIGQEEVSIKTFSQVGYDQHQVLNVQKQPIAPEGLNVVFMQSYGKILIMDDYYFNSAYIQMFVFENYDAQLFEPVIIDPFTKIYRLKK